VFPFEISVRELSALVVQDCTPRLIDCREEDEYKVCRIKGAELMPLTRFREAIDVLENKNEHLVVYCHHGMRSARATEHLRALGFHRAQSLQGGIDSWSQEIDPEVPRY